MQSTENQKVNKVTATPTDSIKIPEHETWFQHYLAHKLNDICWSISDLLNTTSKGGNFEKLYYSSNGSAWYEHVENHVLPWPLQEAIRREYTGRGWIIDIEPRAVGDSRNIETVIKLYIYKQVDPVNESSAAS